MNNLLRSLVLMGATFLLFLGTRREGTAQYNGPTIPPTCCAQEPILPFFQSPCSICKGLIAHSTWVTALTKTRKTLLRPVREILASTIRFNSQKTV